MPWRKKAMSEDARVRNAVCRSFVYGPLTANTAVQPLFGDKQQVASLQQREAPNDGIRLQGTGRSYSQGTKILGCCSTGRKMLKQQQARNVGH